MHSTDLKTVALVGFGLTAAYLVLRARATAAKKAADAARAKVQLSSAKRDQRVIENARPGVADPIAVAMAHAVNAPDIPETKNPVPMYLSPEELEFVARRVVSRLNESPGVDFSYLSMDSFNGGMDPVSKRNDISATFLAYDKVSNTTMKMTTRVLCDSIVDILWIASLRPWSKTGIEFMAHDPEANPNACFQHIFDKI